MMNDLKPCPFAAVKQDGMKRIKPHNVQSALQQYRLVAVYFGNGLMRADIGHIWLLYGTAVLERRKHETD